MGGVFWLVKPKIEPCGLGFGLVCVVQSAVPKGGACGAVYVDVAVVGGGDEESQWGWVVSAANPKTEPRRLSFGQACANQSARRVGSVHAVSYVIPDVMDVCDYVVIGGYL